MTEELTPRDNVPDVSMVADHLIEDASTSFGVARLPGQMPQTVEIAHTFLDSITTMEGLSVDDLMLLAIELARRVIASTSERD